MDIRTGKTYETLDEALADGVPRSDIAEVRRNRAGELVVKFSRGSFKTYRRNEDGSLARVVSQ